VNLAWIIEATLATPPEAVAIIASIDAGAHSAKLGSHHDIVLRCAFDH
jgi:hypothetical protein